MQFAATRARKSGMLLGGGILQRKCACSQHASGAHCDNCKKKHETLQRYPAEHARANNVPPIVHEVLRSPGRPLDRETRAFMEPRFGRDFSEVRVHTDSKAAESARAVNALAYTVGQHIAFAHPAKTISDPSARKLIAHELAHVVQQDSISASFPGSETHRPIGIGAQNSPFERQATSAGERLEHQSLASAVFSSSGLQLQRTSDSEPTKAGKSKEAKREGAPPLNLRQKVREWLEQTPNGEERLRLPLVADSEHTPTGKRRVFYGPEITTLDAVTDDVTDVIGQTNPGVRRSDVWSEVWQYYNELKAKAERDRWQTVIQVLYTPQLTVASTQPLAPGAPSSPWQHSLQISGGRNFRLHPSGGSGTELTIQGNLSLFSLAGGHPETGRDAFQNLLLSAQLQQVWNLGKEFRIGSEWSVVQASLFAQLAAGVGGSYVDEGKDRKIFVGFLAQPSAGGQVNLNIGWFQVIAQGSVVYSYFSPTAQKGSTSQHSGAVQFGLGVGAQF